MLVAGSVDVSTLDLEVYDDTTTQAHLVIIDPDGVQTTVSVEKENGGARWTAEVPYDRPGLWQHLWSVTGKGRGAAPPRTVSVAPAAVPAGRRYATTAQLAEYLGEAVPDDANKLLERATDRVDDILLTAVYAVDEDGMPLDPAVKAALAKATCAQVAWYLETGDDGTGVGARVSSASIGGVSIGWGTGPGAGVPPVSPDVRAALAEAGLLNHAPRWY